MISFIPHQKLRRWIFFPDKEIEDQGLNYSLKVTQLLSGSDVYVLSTTYHGPHCQGLHGPPNTDSRVPLYVVSELESSAPSEYDSTLLSTHLQTPGEMVPCFSECLNTDDGTRPG